MRFLITGGAGFIGSELGWHLATQGHFVRLLDNLEFGYKENFESMPELANNFVEADVRNDSIREYLEDVDIIFHFAGISSLPECEANPAKAFDVNTTSVARLLSHARNSHARRIIFASTSAVYENNNPTEEHRESDIVHPNLVYSTSKYCAEQICKSYAENYGMDIIICRFFNVYGPHQDFHRKYPPFTSYLAREVLAGRTPTIYNTSASRRDYIFVTDLLHYLVLMAESQKHYQGEIFNLASGNAYTPIEIAETIFSLAGKVPIYETGNPDTFWMKYPELSNKLHNLSEKRVGGEVFKHCLGQPDKLRAEFGYSPQIGLRDGLKLILDFQAGGSEA